MQHDLSQLKCELEKLNPAVQAEFRAWFIARDYDQWDTQIAYDLDAGKLDGLISEAGPESVSR